MGTSRGGRDERPWQADLFEEEDRYLSNRFVFVIWVDLLGVLGEDNANIKRNDKRSNDG